MLSEARLDELRGKFGKIGIVEFSGHTIVFRRPTREHVREYRRKLDSPAEKADALDQLAQATILAFDDIDEPNAARTIFTGTFLEEYPAAVGNGRFNACLSVLSGIVEEEDATDLGKGVSVLGARPKSSLTA